jgi:gas vesicle protein
MLSGRSGPRPLKSTPGKKTNVSIHNNIVTNMNTKKSFLLAALLATVTTLSSFAQSAPPTRPAEKLEKQEKPEKPEKPGGGRGVRGPGIEVPRIGMPEKVFTTLPQALQDQITKYREQSKTFIDAQRDLAKTLGTVTDEQRNAIREQLKANRDKFLTDTQQVRTEIRDQLKDLGVSVRENKPSGGGGSGGGKGPGRPRG